MTTPQQPSGAQQPPVVGYTPEQLEAAALPLEAATAAALVAVAAGAARLITAPAGAPAGVAGAAFVTLDDLAMITRLWVQHTDRQLMPILRNVFHESADHVHGQIGKLLAGITELPPGVTELPAEPGLIPDVYAEDLMAAARNRLVGIGDVLWANARQQLAEGMREGESIPQLAARVRTAAGVSEPRATVIARTEVISTSNLASIAQARSAGVPLEKQWMATDDSRTRPTHVLADGQQVPLDEPFIVGGFPLDVPGDPAGPPQETIQCRCSIGFHLGTAPLVAAARVPKLTGESLGAMSFSGKQVSPDGPVATSMVEAARRRGLSDAEIWEYFDGWSNGYLGVREQEPTTAAGGLSGAELEEFNRLHRRDRKGRFADKIGDAIRSGVTGALDEFTREQLRRYATQDRGLVLPRGAHIDVIKERLLKSAGRQVTGAVPLEPPALPDRAGLGRKTIPELRELAKAHGLKIPAKARKVEIVDLLAGPPAKEQLSVEIAPKAALPDLAPGYRGAQGAARRRQREKVLTLIRDAGGERGVQGIADREAAEALESMGYLRRTPSGKFALTDEGRAYFSPTEAAPDTEHLPPLGAARSGSAPRLLTMFPPEGQEQTLERNLEIFDAVSKAIGGTYAGAFEVEVTRADHLGGGAGYESNPRGFLSFGGRITADGRNVGTFRRFITYTRDQDPVTGEFVGDWHWAAHHDKMVLDPQVQGAGFARDFNANWYDWYRRSGIEYVDLGAGESVGGYAWATQGFDFKTQTGMRAFILGAETPEEEFSGSSANLDWDRMPGWTREKQQAQEPLLNAVEERVRNGEWVSAYELSQLGRQPGEGKEDWWIGKAMMFGSSWDGRMAL